MQDQGQIALSEEQKVEEEEDDRVGTPYYLAPELWKK